MHESHETRNSLLLPRRLVHRVPLIEPSENATAVAAGLDNWGLSRRISSLPGVSAKCTVLDDGAVVTDHIIDPAYVLRSSYCAPRLLCHIDCEGISLPQLDPGDDAEVLLKGWASGAEDGITMFLPRDSIEMEIAWRIILRAYQYQASRPPRIRGVRKAAPELPKCAATAKYWM